MKNIYKSSDREFIRRNAKKIRSIMISGNKCKECGTDLYNEPWYASFHHLDPSIKEHSITNMLSKKNWIEIKNELSKCILLCLKCHFKIHFDSDRLKQHKEAIYKLAMGNKLDKMWGRKATKEEIQKAGKLLGEGLTYKEVSQKIKFRESTIRIWFPANHNFDFSSQGNEEKIINMYENQKMTLSEVSNILHCSIRKLKTKILSMVKDGRISRFRKNKSNQHTKNPLNIIINGNKYVSATEASKILNIGRSTVYSRLKRNASGYSYFTQRHQG